MLDLGPTNTSQSFSSATSWTSGTNAAPSSSYFMEGSPLTAGDMFVLLLVNTHFYNFGFVVQSENLAFW